MITPAPSIDSAPLRIAIVSDYFLDFVGGAQTSMRQQQRALGEAGHTVVMVSAARGHGPRVRRVDDGIQLRPQFTLPGLELPVIPNNRATRETLLDYLREQRIDVVHVQTEFGLANAAASVAASLGIPVVHTVHTFYWASEGWHKPIAPIVRALVHVYTGASVGRQPFTPRPVDNLLRNLTLAMAQRADAVISPSAHQGRDLQEAGLTTPVSIVPNPIAISPRPPIALAARDDELPSFLWVARCEPIKRPLVFAEAVILALGETDGAFTVDFVGDGADHAALTRLAAGHPEMHVLGGLPNEYVMELMDASSAVVLSSVGFDNQPMTIAEAVSRGRGILYCDPKLREGLAHAGFLATTPDARGLADALVALVTTDGAFERLAEGAEIDGAQFTPETYVARAVEVFRTTATRVRR